LELRQLYSFYKIYEEIKDDIGYFVRLYTLAKVARMGVEQVIRLLGIANNDLQSVEYRYERLKREVDAIEAEKRNSARIFQELSIRYQLCHKVRLYSSGLRKRNVTTSRFATTKNETRGSCKTI